MSIAESRRSAWAAAMQSPWQWNAENAGPWSGVGRMRLHGGQRYGENRSASGRGSRFNIAAMFTKNCLANAQAQPRTSSGPFGCIERVENIGQYLRRNSGAIILKRNAYCLTIVVAADSQCPALACFADSLFGIANQVEKYLHQLMGISTDQTHRFTKEIHRNIVFAQRIGVQMYRALNQLPGVNWISAGRRRP